MSDWASYRLQDFIPFTADVYFRLLAQMGETFWPLQLATLAMGLAALVLVIRGRNRLALFLLAPLWAFIAVAFFNQRYATLNWAGGYLCWAWLLQAVLIVGIASTGVGCNRAASLFQPPLLIGVFLAVTGLIGLPMASLSVDASWQQAELFGLYPDPTAIATLGIALLVLRGPTLWGVVLIPMLWLVVSAVTLKVLEAPTALTLAGGLAVALIGTVWKSLSASTP